MKIGKTKIDSMELIAILIAIIIIASIIGTVLTSFAVQQEVDYGCGNIYISGGEDVTHYSDTANCYWYIYRNEVYVEKDTIINGDTLYFWEGER